MVRQSCRHSGSNGKQWRVVAAFIVGMLSWEIQGSAIAANDEWPIRLKLSDSSTGNQNQWVVTAENLADFPCTKLRLEASISGGKLLGGGGQSPARVVDGKLVFDEIASLRSKDTYRWTIDFDRGSEGDIRIEARLRYAESGNGTAKEMAQPKQTSSRKNCADYSPPSASGMTASEISFPTGSRSTSALLVHQVMPVEVDRNKPYTYQYHVTNISSVVLQNVELVATGFQNLRVSKTDPAAQTQGETLRWMLGDLEVCETRIINANATSPEIGNASACLTATFSNRLCAATRVVEPGLKITKTAPAEALVCDEVTMELVVTNPGSGVTRGVKVTDDLPEGLTTSDGKKKVESDVGNLNPGESKKVTFKVKAARPGSYTNQAMARAAGDLSADSNKTVTVFRQPVLQISCSAPDERFIGRGAAVNIEVKNTGDTASANTVVSASVPAGAEVAGISKGGSPGKGEITWNVGSLSPGTSQTFAFEAKASQSGLLSFSASASGTCAAQVKSACQTKITGIPAILLEVVDIDDPVEVGKNTTYVITVTNQGSAPGTNIKVGCDLPPESSFVSATGHSTATAAGKRVTFAPVPSIAPKQKVEWRMTVSATAPGDARLAVDLASDQFSAPIRETESTNQYK